MSNPITYLCIRTGTARKAGLTYVPHGPTNPVPRRRLVIDHVLCSPGIAVRTVRVEPTAMSDHAALLVDVDLQEVDHARMPGQLAREYVSDRGDAGAMFGDQPAHSDSAIGDFSDVWLTFGLVGVE